MKETTAHTLRIIKALPSVIKYKPGSFALSEDIRSALLQQGTFVSYKAIGRAMGFLGYSRGRDNKGLRGYQNVALLSNTRKEEL
jgi:hypothetical protein